MEYHAAVDFEGSTFEIAVRQSVAPYCEEIVDQVWNVASFPEVIDGEVRMSRLQCDLPRHDDLNHPCVAIYSQEFLSFASEKRLRHVLVEFGPVSQVVTKIVDHSAAGERQMDLPFSVPGFAAWSILVQGRIEPVGDLVPPRVG